MERKDIFEPDASASELAAAGKWDESQQAATQLAAAALATIPSSASLAVPTRAQAQAQRQHTRRHSAQSHPAPAGPAVGSPKRKTVSSTNLVAAGAADRLRSKHDRSRSGGDKGGDKAVVEKVVAVGGDKGDDQAVVDGNDDDEKKNAPWKGKEETREEWNEREDAITKQLDDELKTRKKKKELKLKLKQRMQERGSAGVEKISAQSTAGAYDETTTATLRSLVDFWRGFATGLCAALVLLALVFTAVYLGAAQTAQRHKEDL